MLSTAAWNAFLKTLEEPPPHTIFVLATTEAAKVLPTVVDRCHRFDFARPSVPQIAGVLRKVAAAEEIEIARRGGGARRPLGHRLVPRRARHARAARRLLGPRDRARGRARGARRRRRRPACSAPSTRSPPATRGRRCWPPRGWPTPAATSAASSATSRRTRAALMVVQALGEVPAELRVTPEQDERLAAQAQHGRAGRRRAPARADRRRAARDEGRRRRPHPARARAVKAAEPAHDPSAKALLARIERLEGRAPAAAPPRDPAQPATAAGRTRWPCDRRSRAAPVAATTTMPGRRRAPPPGAGGGRRGRGRGRRAADAPAAAVAVVEPDAPAGDPSVELSLDAFARALAGGAREPRGRVADARRDAARGAPDRARRRGPHARLAASRPRSPSARPRSPPSAS